MGLARPRPAPSPPPRAHTGPDVGAFIRKIHAGYVERGLLPAEFAEQSKLVDNMVAEGKLGRKSGQGFYDVGPQRRTARPH